jgi:predicted HTH domain antitoxin
MILSIPDEIIQATGMSEDDLRQELAVLLFQSDKLTLAQARRLAGMPQLQFQRLLGSRQIAPHYDLAEFEADLETLRSLGRI